MPTDYSNTTNSAGQPLSGWMDPSSGEISIDPNRGFGNGSIPLWGSNAAANIKYDYGKKISGDGSVFTNDIHAATPLNGYVLLQDGVSLGDWRGVYDQVDSGRFQESTDISIPNGYTLYRKSIRRRTSGGDEEIVFTPSMTSVLDDYHVDWKRDYNDIDEFDIIESGNFEPTDTDLIDSLEEQQIANDRFVSFDDQWRLDLLSGVDRNQIEFPDVSMISPSRSGDDSLDLLNSSRGVGDVIPEKGFLSSVDSGVDAFLKGLTMTVLTMGGGALLGPIYAAGAFSAGRFGATIQKAKRAESQGANVPWGAVFKNGVTDIVAGTAVAATGYNPFAVYAGDRVRGKTNAEALESSVFSFGQKAIRNSRSLSNKEKLWGSVGLRATQDSRRGVSSSGIAARAFTRGAIVGTRVY